MSNDPLWSVYLEFIGDVDLMNAICNDWVVRGHGSLQAVRLQTK